MKELPDGTMVENWTSHEVVLYDAEKNREVFIPQEDRAPIRLNTSRVRVSRYLFKVDFMEPAYIPEERPGVYLIVSSPVKQALHERHDLITPHDVIRDYKGMVTACRCFAM